MSALILASDRDVALARKTVAQELNNIEFDLFMHMCRHWQLDPLRRQIYAHVYKRRKKELDDNGNEQWVTTRNVVYVTGIDGYRAIADRTGNYRPGQRSVETSDAAKDPDTNPAGIVSATASVWKHVHGEWHEFSETVYWDEFAPLKEIWENNKATGRFRLDTSGNWARMGRVMLQKCAEAQALRRGWPDAYGDLYVTEEMDQAKIIDITPSEQAEQAEQAAKLALVGGKDAITVQWEPNKPTARVPLGKFADATLEWASQKTTTSTEMRIWFHNNLAARTEYKAKKPAEWHEWNTAWLALTDKKEADETNQDAA